MIPEIGQISLILALLLSIVLAVVPMWGAATNNSALMRVSKTAACGQFVMVALAFAVLTYGFIAQDFSIKYVMDNSNLQLPLIYRYTAVWGGHEGSKLLWALVLSIWTLAVTARSSQLPERFAARLLSVLGMIGSGFISFLVFTSNPFVRFLPSATDGNDLNPLLQDPGMIVHPPLLYMGYVGLAVPFAFAIAALLEGKLDSQWVRWTRPWTLVAWSFLTAGIALGSWWAYYELGWGGWWFWDPVENASFMPWLIGAALIHCQAVTEKRGTFVNWTLLLSIAGFSLSLLGTFLVRSGILTSVHAFASDPKRGAFILSFLTLVVGGALLLYTVRASRLQNRAQELVFSKEKLLLANNVLLVSACVLVLCGTLWPLVSEGFMNAKVSVGAPWFGQYFSLLMAPLLLLIPLGAFTKWQRGEVNVVRQSLKLAAGAAALLTIALMLYFKILNFKAHFGVLVGFWILFGTAAFLLKRWRASPPGQRFTFEMLAMSVAHMGVGLWAIGVVMTETLSIERDVRLAPGETVQVGTYSLRMDAVDPMQGPNYVADRGTFTLLKNEQVVSVLHPEKRRYLRGNVMTEAAIDPSFFRDIYVALGEPLASSGTSAEPSGAAWSVRAYHKPFIRWIWLGAVLMALGGLLGACERRLRKPVIEARSVETVPNGFDRPEVAPLGLASRVSDPTP